VLFTVTLGGGLVAMATVPAYAAASITVTPATGLANGQMVTITGSGFTKASIGNVLECNTDPNQPTVHDGGVVNADISISCNAPSFSHLVTVDASGNISTTFTVVGGTVGPPCGPAPAVVTCAATDSANKDPVADAANYPCPPTAAQQAAGDTCTLTYGDQANDTGVATILFAGETAPSAPTTTAAPAPTTTAPRTTATTAPRAATPTTAAAAAPATASAGSTLASTGPGPHLWTVAIIGFVVLYLGSATLALVERPRTLLRRRIHLSRAGPAAVAAVGVVDAPPTFAPPPRPARPEPPVHHVDTARRVETARAAPTVAPDPPRPAPVHPKTAASEGLWFTGWEPENLPR
jgi:hypothetical protein